MSPKPETGAQKRKADEVEDTGVETQAPTKKQKSSPIATGSDTAPTAGSKENTPGSSKPAGPKVFSTGTLTGLKGAKKAPQDRAHPKPRRERTPPSAARQREPEFKRRSRSPSRSPPRQRRRPGGGARLNRTGVDAVKQRQEAREKEANEAAAAEAARRGNHEVVTEHYNAVPQRGREWRTSDSQIKGLRSFNNWVKSAIIQKFSPGEDYTPGARQQGYYGQQQKGLRVLDIGCGKGGDLQKWQNAPQALDLYVALDPAAVSINQARGRYEGMPKMATRGEFRGRPLYHAEFFTKDCFGEPLSDVPIVKQVGIDYNGGPMAQGGFDVVSMMFCMHYAFENEARAKGMLQNVSASLKKGGRFLGVIPNSDVLSAKVKALTGVGTASKRRAGDSSERLANEATKTPKVSGELNYDDDNDWNPEASADAQPKVNGSATAANDSDDEWDPEKASDPATEAAFNGTTNDSEDDWDPEKPTSSTATPAVPVASSSTPAAPTPHSTNANGTPATQNGIEWGNSKYSVKFPGAVPRDGTFRPTFGWKYFFFLEEAVETVPEYVVPWEAFRAMAVHYDLELQYRKPFLDVWNDEKNEPALRELSERMGVRNRQTGELMVSKDELEAASFYHAFCFYKA